MLSIENVDKALGRSVNINSLVYMITEINKLKDCYIFHLQSTTLVGAKVTQRIMMTRERAKGIGKYTFTAFGIANHNVWGVDYPSLHGVDSFIKELQLFLHNSMNV
jgi:hypothetical protein